MHIVLYLDQGTTLSVYNSIGTLEREMALYRALADAGHSITVLSWGKGEDDALISQFPAFNIIQNKSWLPNRVWMLLQLIKLKSRIKQEFVVLTNQLNGAYLVSFAKLLGRYRLVLRFGYLRSTHFCLSSGRYSWAHFVSSLNEYISSYFATRIVATTSTIAAEFAKMRRLKSKIRVIPNYIDGSVFFPFTKNQNQQPRENFRIVTTTRLSATQKRTDLLIKALASLEKVELLIVGVGSEQASLEKLANDLKVKVKFLGMVQNNSLRELYSECDIFCLCSEYEGHPKALIEAMACGIPVVATDVRGNSDSVTNDETGLLVDLDVKAIAAAVQRLRADPKLRLKLAENAVAFTQKYSLKSYVKNIEEVLLSS